MIWSREVWCFGFRNKTDKENMTTHEFLYLIVKMDAINNKTSDSRNYVGTNQEEIFP
ncbi:MAG: hypothetical protein ABJM36_08190 [Algibacter sp.]|uniref:hypothetical protein n=1 Tax=Algibacter sp. TaxID=1872428 RepID=UPI003297E27D